MIRVPASSPGRMQAEEKLAVEQAIAKVMKRGVFIGGEFVREFEEVFANYHGAGFECVSVGNGEDALTIALLALDLKPSSKVLVPANDGGFAALAVQNSGHYSIPVESDYSSGLINFDDLDSAWSDGVSALIVTHLHGAMVETQRFKNWCESKRMILIEDCSQAHGARKGESRVGTAGHIATYSFYPTKNLGALGDGGAILTRESHLAKRARHLSNYGWQERYDINFSNGKNSRLDSMQAAILSAKLPFLEANNEARIKVLNLYRRELKSLRFLGTEDSATVAHHAVFVSEGRNQIAEYLESQGITVQIHYPKLIQEMKGIKKIHRRETRSAKNLTRDQLSLPCFPTLENEEISRVIQATKEAQEKFGN